MDLNTVFNLKDVLLFFGACCAIGFTHGFVTEFIRNRREKEN